MNLNIDIHNFSLVNINFLDTKKNIIMDGNFTKIIYSNQWFTVNSIFICFPIEWTSIEKVANKYVLRFNPYSTKNLSIVQDFARLETRILEYFKTFFNLNVRISNSFSKQLYTGNMKIFKEYIGDFSSSFDSHRLGFTTSVKPPFRAKLSEDDQPFVPEAPQNLHNDSCCQQKNFVIKVSGIWENYEEIGLTFKLMEQGTKFPL